MFSRLSLANYNSLGLLTCSENSEFNEKNQTQYNFVFRIRDF